MQAQGNYQYDRRDIKRILREVMERDPGLKSLSQAT